MSHQVHKAPFDAGSAKLPLSLQEFNELLTAVIDYADTALGKIEVGHPARDSVARVMRAARRAVDQANEAAAFEGEGEMGRNSDTAPVVLVVDDDAISRELLAAYLSNAGYRIAKAENGREALDVVRETPPDLVITDIVMPEQEGIQTIVELQKQAGDIPIIAISGGGGIGDSATGMDIYLGAALRFGAKRVFRKPVNRNEIVEAVAELTASVKPERRL